MADDSSGAPPADVSAPAADPSPGAPSGPSESAEGVPAGAEGAAVPSPADPAGTEAAPVPAPADSAEGVPAAAEAAVVPAPPVKASPRSRPRLLPLLVALVGAVVPLVIMCTERRFRFSVPVGVVGCLAFAWGLLDATRSLDPLPDREAASSTTLRALAPRLAAVVGSLVLYVVALSLAVAGVLPAPRATAAIIVPATFLALVVSLYRVGQKLGVFREEDGTELPLTQRHGFWLVVLNTLLYVPLLGSYSLTDPWETHYGEVAREILARDDWISTWWAQDGWFWSKPVLGFWMQALAFSLLGVRYLPDQMLSRVSEGLFPQPEWAARTPVFLVTLAGTYALYRAIANVYGRRAGFLSSLVLMTMPYWYLISHQTMADMPYVATLAGAMGLVLMGFLTDPEQKLRVYELRAGSRTFHLTALHLLLAIVLVSVLPQVLYLISRNLTLHLRPDLTGFRFHLDEFFSGSGEHNCGLPGNQHCGQEKPVHSSIKLWFVDVPVWPITMAGVWTLVGGYFFWSKRKEQRLQRLYFLGGWFFLAVSMMGKGAPGLVLPVATALAFVGVTRRWKDLERIELGSLVLIAAAVGLPWYVQMYLRHGAPFIDRLIMHDMYKRAFVHVHDTNAGDDTSFRYYIWQLGYGLFPWTGLATGGLLWSLRRPDRTRDRQGDAAAFMLVWLVAAFGMFTITLTKFHHYILPLVPPTAVLTGVVVDRLLGPGSPARQDRLTHYAAGCVGSVTLVLYGIFRLFPRRLTGEALPGDPPWRGWAYLCIALGIATLVVTVRKLGSPAERTPDPATRHDSAMLAALGLGSAVLVALAGRDLFTVATSGGGGPIRLMQLFTYNYTRAFPETLDFKGALIAFTAVSAVLSLGLAMPLWRKHAMALLTATSVVWAAWGLDVYLYQCSPHWGQRETVLAYYQDRKSPEHPLVAYQMNWKGENFYTGNRVPAFVSSGEKFKTWVNEQKTKGVTVMYFTTEHGRVGSLKRELGDPPKFTQLTSKALNNKFFVARVEF